MLENRRDGGVPNSGSNPGAKLLLLGDDLVLDLVVGGLRENLLLHQVGFLGIGTAVNNLLRINGADAGQGVELVLGGRVDIQQVR